MQSECSTLHFVIRGLPVCLSVPHYSTLSHKRHDFRGKNTLLNKEYVFLFFLSLSEISLIVRRTLQYIIINLRKTSREVLVIPVRFQSNLNFLDEFSKKNIQIPNFVKILPVGAELFQVDRETDKT